MDGQLKATACFSCKFISTSCVFLLNKEENEHLTLPQDFGVVLFLERKRCRKYGQRVILLSIFGEDLSSVHDQWGLECWHAPPANVRSCFYIYMGYVNKKESVSFYYI